MAPTWKEEVFALIDEEWDEETTESATAGAHDDAAPTLLMASEEPSEIAVSTKVEEEIFFMTDEASVVENHVYDATAAPLADVLGARGGVLPHAALTRALLEDAEGVIQEPLVGNVFFSPRVRHVYLALPALEGNVELSHTNYTDSANDLIFSLGSGYEICFVEHFNAYGIGRKVTLVIGREALSPEAEDAFLSGQWEGMLPEDAVITTLPENFGVVSSLQRQLENELARQTAVETA